MVSEKISCGGYDTTHMVSYAHMTCKAHAHSTYIGLILVAKPNVSLCIESITRVNFC